MQLVKDGIAGDDLKLFTILYLALKPVDSFSFDTESSYIFEGILIT